MSVQGMKAWLENSGVQDRIFTQDGQGELVLKDDYEKLRRKSIMLFNAGKPQKTISAELCKGSDLMVLVFVMTLVEDIGLPIADVDPHYKTFYKAYVYNYLVCTSDGGRALPQRDTTAAVVARTREMAGARR